MSQRSGFRTLLRVPAFLVILAVTGTTLAAPLLPPSMSIRRSEHAVVLATVLEVVDGETVRFRRDDVLQEDRAFTERGEEPPQEVVVRVGPEVAASVSPGERYVLAYTSLVVMQKYKYSFSIDPEGPRIVDVPSVGLALLEDSEAMRTLVTPRPAEAELPSRQRIDLILDLVEQAGPTEQRFGMAELMLWKRLRYELEEGDVERFQRVLEGGGLDPLTRQYYFEVFLPIAPNFDAYWLANEARQVIDEYPVELDLGSSGPALVISALQTLREMGEPRDAERALEFLFSNNEAVSLAAFRVGEALDPDATESLVEMLVWEGDLPGETVAAAVRFLTERQTARRQGEGAG